MEKPEARQTAEDPAVREMSQPTPSTRSGSTAGVAELPSSAGPESSRAVRTVKLELLRHGPAHNHLLSPLTPYLALCGNHDAETVSVGFEHLDLLLRIQQLRYEMGSGMAAVALRESSEEVTRLLESIRSLTSELSTSDPLEGKRRVHLRIVLSASELALLPFELAKVSSGLQGHGQYLSLQTVSPMCITREARRVAASTFEWPDQVRILIISAAPPPMAAVPLREHLRAIREALQPYMVYREEDGADFQREFASFVTVLPEASLAAVHKACRETPTPYTHVHVLAHGIGMEGAVGEAAQYGLAFHSAENPNETDIVTGERLAAALLSHGAIRAEHKRSKPVVLTIASCDSANQGAVLAPGASVAHELHEHGIPLVIGSQFPLTVKGSVIMAEEIYKPLLSGADPRDVIVKLRNTLRALLPDSVHDWASIVVYAALPADLDSQLKRVGFERAGRALETVMTRIDHLLQQPPEDRRERQERQGRLAALQEELIQAMEHLKKSAPKDEDGAEQLKAIGVLASASKQVAWFLNPTQEKGPGSAPRKVSPQFRETLEQARRYYFACYQAGERDSWPLVQYLSLTVALEPDWNTQDFKDRWTSALVLSRDALNAAELRRRVWALSSMTELTILSAAWEDPQECERQALGYIQELFQIVRPLPYKKALFDAYSLYRQIRRYYLWEWGTPAMISLSQRLGKVMKASGAKEHWIRG